MRKQRIALASSMRSALRLCAISILVLVAFLNEAEGLAADAVSTGDYHHGKSKSEIAEALKRQGYEVEELENEGGFNEVEAAVNGISYEIRVNPNSGIIVDIKEDD